MSLYRAELRRLSKRRFARWMMIGVLLVLGTVAIGMAISNQKVGPDQVAAAQAEAQKAYQEQLAYSEQDRQRCELDPQAYGGDCSTLWVPTQEDFQYQNYMPSTFEFRQTFGYMLTTLAALLGLAAFVIGASYVGAEWTSGGMMNLLLWRPQRLLVLGTKLGAFLSALAAITVVLAALWTGLFVLIANLRGTMDGMTSGAWQSTMLTELRALVMILVAGAVGFGLAALGRHTAIALGVAAGAVVVFQFGLYAVMSVARVPYAEVVLLPTWANVWMDKEMTLQNYYACDFSANQGCQPAELTLTWPTAGGLMAAIVVLVVGAAMWSMRSRDIT